MANLLDILFPKYCVNCKKLGEFLCTDCFSHLSMDTKNICLVCGGASYNSLTHPRCHGKYKINGTFTAIVFDSITKKLIHQFKYEPYLLSMSQFLGNLFYESLIQNEEFEKILRTHPKNDIFLMPIPLSSKRLRTRGYNQAEVLAKELSKKFDFPVINGLIRVKETKPQVDLNKEERIENMRDAFKINKKYSDNFQNSNVILVDDVLTTGSTFSEAAGVLKHHGARGVWAVAFAKED